MKTQFIELHTENRNRTFVNVSLITSLYENKTSENCVVSFSENDYFTSKESYEEVCKMLTDPIINKSEVKAH